MKRVFLILSILLVATVVNATASIDELICKLESKLEKGTVEEITRAYDVLLKELQDKEKFSEMILESRNAILYSEANNDLKLLPQFLHFEGYANERQGNYNEALRIYDQILKFEEEKVPSNVSVSYTHLTLPTNREV